LRVHAVVDAVNNLEVLWEAVRLAFRRDGLDALAARVVLRHFVLAVVLQALLLKSQLDINRVRHVTKVFATSTLKNKNKRAKKHNR
jgi:hypothetical protein